MLHHRMAHLASAPLPSLLLFVLPLCHNHFLRSCLLLLRPPCWTCLWLHLQQLLAHIAAMAAEFRLQILLLLLLQLSVPLRLRLLPLLHPRHLLLLLHKHRFRLLSLS